MLYTFCVPRGLLHQYIAAISACLGIVGAGISYVWITTALGHLMGPDTEVALTPEQASWIVSILLIGTMVTSLPAGFLSNKFGRKIVLLTSSPLYIASWVIVLFIPTPVALGVSRVIQGVCLGIVFTVVPVYLGEISSNSNRGTITSLLFNSWWLGLVISYAVGPFLSYREFTYFTLAANIPLLLTFWWQPETPSYYLMAGNEGKALESLEWLRDVDADQLKIELQQIKNNVEEKSKSMSLQDIVATPVDRRALSLLIVVVVVRVLSGTGVLMIYATQIFQLTPRLSIQSDTVTIMFGTAMFLGSCSSSFLSDSMGRRPILLISSVGSFISILCVGIYYVLLFDTSVEVAPFIWFAPVFILLYSALCAAGLYPVSSTYTSELFTSSTRGVASSIGAITMTVSSFLMLKAYQIVTDNFGIGVNFLLYSLVSLIGSIYIYMYAPETKGKSFSQIREYLSRMGSSSSSNM